MAGNLEENQQHGWLTDLDKNKKRWLITGIVLHSVMTPTIREYVTDSLEQIYQTLKQNSNIDTQLHPNHLKSYLTTFLNYEAINGNKTLGLRQQSRFDYKVKDAVDFSKLFLQTNMAHYTAFDDSCDSSALLGIIIGSCSSASQVCAKKVKDDVRNPWAHCDFTKWDDNKYKTCMKLIKELIESLGFQNQGEIISLLQKWNQNGDKYIDGTSPEFVVVGEVQTQVLTLLSRIEKIAFDTPDLISKLKEELNSVISDLTMRVQALEKAHQETTATVERLNERLDKKEDTIPKHMKEKYEIHIEDWIEDEKQFTVTTATEHVTGLVEENNVVVVTGSSGSGKSSLIHHVALKLKKQGYTIIPFVTNPDDIIQYRDIQKNQLFIIDDLCGKNYIDETDLQIWKKQTDTIDKLFPNEKNKERGKLKILVSCRLQIYKDEKFKSLKLFTQEAVDLQSEKYRLRSDEKRKILGNYITNEVLDYRWQEIQEKLEDCHFFPLLCKIAKNKNVEQLTDLFSSPIKCMRDDIKDMIRTKPMENCALVMCVLFPDGYDEDYIDPRTRPQEVQQKVIDIIDTYEINLANERKRAQLRNTFKRLDGTYVKKTGPIYTISHDKLYDLVAVEGFYQAIELYLKYAPSTLIAEQFRFTSVFPNAEDQLVIYLDENNEKLYLKRCFEDLQKKSYKPFFNNQQLKEEKYRNKVMEYIDQNKESCDELFRRLDREGITEERENWYADKKTYTYTTTPLIEATKAGFYNLIKYLIAIKCDLNKHDSYNLSPLWYSCDNGFITIIRLLLKHHVKYVAELVTACKYGKTDAVRVMVEEGLVDLTLCESETEQTPLNAACSNGYSKIALILVSHNVNYNVDDLVEACRHGMTDVVRVMVERGLVDLSQCDSKHRKTPIRVACEKGHNETVKLLLIHNVNYKIDDLVMACRSGITGAVRVMVERGLVDLTQCGRRDGWTPLTAACRCGHSEIVNLLLSHNANYNVDDLVLTCGWGMTAAARVMVERRLVDLTLCNRYGLTALRAACEEGHSDIVNLLLGHDVNYNVDDLVEACRWGMTAAARVMVERGLVDLSHCDSKYRKTPMGAACEGGHSEIVKLLLSHNVNYNVDDLVMACLFGMTDAARVMVERGLVGLTLCSGKYGDTPLRTACKGGHSEIVNLLINHNVNYNVDDLVEACRSGMTDIARVMVESGLVDLTLCGRKRDQTPLNAACEEGHSEIVNLLLSHNVSYNVDDLVEACIFGMTDAVGVMVKRGLVDLRQCHSHYGWTPLNAACEEGHSKIVRMLLEDGADPSQRDRCGKIALDYTDDETIMNLLKLNMKQ